MCQLFPKYSIESHFLMWNNVYVYQEEDLSNGVIYQKKWLMSIINDMGYLRGSTHT